MSLGVCTNSGSRHMIQYEQGKESAMNNYRNYGNYGNRRYSGGMDMCGYKKEEVMQGADCGCKKPEVKPGTDCGCKKPEVKPGMDCGCMKEDKKEDSCGCAVESMYRDRKMNGGCCEEDMPGKALAMAYVPWQSWRKLYEVCEGFSTGTIFKELDLEFYGRRCN